MKMKPEIEVGDVVCLRSGGPRMTVDDTKDVGNVRCVWFDGADTKFDLFNPAALTVVEKAQS